MEYQTNRCRAYTLPVFSSDFETTQPAASTNPLPYMYSFDSISSSGYHSTSSLKQTIDKKDPEKKNVIRSSTNYTKLEDDLPHFNPLDDLLYLASTFTDRY